WNYGSYYALHRNNIKFGIVGTQMIAWGEVLSDPQIDAVLNYILEKEKEMGVEPPPPKERSETEHYNLKVEVLAEGLKQPWGIEFIDERTAVFSENIGQLRLMVDGKVLPEPISGTPSPARQSSGQREGFGYMDVALHPRYAENGWIYLCYIHEAPDIPPGKVKRPWSTRIVRGRIRNHEWIDEEAVYDPRPEDYTEIQDHFGSRMVFDDNENLYFSIGDRGRKLDAQNLSRPEGKFHRIHDDGRPVEDNPYNSLERYGALPTVFAYGTRNAQGLAMHPETREIWSAEHGPMGGDELNVVRAGANYGWPLTTKGIDRDGTVLTPYKSLPGMVDPIQYWIPSPAFCGIEFADSPLFPAWNNNLLVAALKHQLIYRLVLDGDKVVKQEVILRESGRVRDIKTAPDGSIYVLIDRRGMILRLTPENNE
ncbi:MAG: PQQ-dependent sugar dehydrogenase, partial [Verrucomicrobiia bacterium]